jgi:hypothetical protein
VLRRYAEWAAHAPDEVTTIVILRRNAFAWSGSELQRRPIIGVGALYAGAADHGEEALAPLRELGQMLASSVQKRPWTQHQSMLDAIAPAGRLYYLKSQYLSALTNQAIHAIAANAWQFTSPYSFTLLGPMGGAIRERSDDETAFTGRDAEFAINMNCCATEAELYERDRTWMREWSDALTPHSTGGVYVNFISEDSSDRARAAYGEEKYTRLAALKAVYDPQNHLHVNQNIKPGI